jgi:hypothetical protein
MPFETALSVFRKSRQHKALDDVFEIKALNAAVANIRWPYIRTLLLGRVFYSLLFKSMAVKICIF